MSLPNYIPFSKRSEVGKRWAASKGTKRIKAGVDADTVRARALDDSRGQTIREGVTYQGDGTVILWSVRRSLLGRTDQFDAVANGVVIRTGGMRKIIPIFYHR